MSEEIHVNSRLHECCRAWCDSASEAFLASIGANRTIWLTPVDSLQKQEGRHRFLSCYLAISMNIKTAKNSEKQRSAPLFFAGRACPQARISAENEATLAVNFWEEQRKTEKRAALFRGPRLPPSQDFSGERGDARCKFLGRTAKNREARRSFSRAALAPKPGFQRRTRRRSL